MTKKSKQATKQTSNQTVATNNDNTQYSRYYNVLAYDQSRVLLTHDDKEVYVNANRVKVAAADREYILTQGEINKMYSYTW